MGVCAGVVLMAAALVTRSFAVRSASKIEPALKPPIVGLGLAAPHGGRDIRILAGSSGGYTDRQGRVWQADRYYSGGNADRGPKDFFGKPPDAGLFQTMRIGEFSYAIPSPRDSSF